MILVFGGTTEGRRAVEVLEEAGSPFFYSTKTGEQEVAMQHGQRIDGALDRAAIVEFCREHDIRLIVDAAHPFASQLHGNIAEAGLPVVRYERIYPPRDPDITWIDEYSELSSLLPSSREGLGVGFTLFATTGVQSISRLKPLEAKGVRVVYRILRRESSIRLAHEQGATDGQLCFYPDSVKADAILMKESGLSGGFAEKVEEARKLGMRIIVIKRPLLHFKHCVNGPHGLRRDIERLLPEFFPLHSGLTTGTCATAAAVAAVRRLLYGETPEEVPVILPNGETISVSVGYGEGYAYCIKEAGDDPDVTDGIEVRAHPRPLPKAGRAIVIEGGEGVGRFTLPGFDYAPGEPAINRGPREMIEKNLMPLLMDSQLPSLGDGVGVGFSVPHGEEIARRTFNPRLGIEGGISIIGVSGIVKPFSEEAFIDSIRKCMTVAKASGSERVVINSGGKSERFVKALYPDLPQQAFVEYGNYIGETLKMAHELGFTSVTLGVMLGKAVKLAEGHLDTHSRKAVMNKAFVGQMLSEAGCDIDLSHITLARELWEKLPANKLNAFAATIIRHCSTYCIPLLPNGTLTILLIDDNGTIYKQ